MVEWRDVIDTTEWGAGVKGMYAEAVTHALTGFWISDRLPEYTGKTQFVLCSVGGEVPYVTTANYGKRPGDDSPVFWVWSSYGRIEVENVTAWMPQPEPFEGEGLLDELCE